MPTLYILLEDILTDPDRPEDLTRLRANQALARVRQFYDFLPAIDDIALDEGTVTIVIREEEALRTQKRASWAGGQGNCRVYLDMFQEVLAIIPYHPDTYGGLSKTHYEMGDRQLDTRSIRCKQ